MDSNDYRALNSLMRSAARLGAAEISAKGRVSAAHVNAEARIRCTILREIIRKQDKVPDLTEEQWNDLFDTALGKEKSAAYSAGEWIAAHPYYAAGPSWADIFVFFRRLFRRRPVYKLELTGADTHE